MFAVVNSDHYLKVLHSLYDRTILAYLKNFLVHLIFERVHIYVQKRFDASFVPYLATDQNKNGKNLQKFMLL